MPRTVTVRWSVLAAVLLVVVGGTVFVTATQQPSRESSPSKYGVAVSPNGNDDVTATNVSELPREQRGVFLLAVDPGDFGAYYTDDEHVGAAIDGLPDQVRYEGTVYDVSEPTGAADTVPLPLLELAGAAIAGLGVLGLFVAQARSLDSEAAAD